MGTRQGGTGAVTMLLPALGAPSDAHRVMPNRCWQWVTRTPPPRHSHVLRFITATRARGIGSGTVEPEQLCPTTGRQHQRGGGTPGVRQPPGKTAVAQTDRQTAGQWEGGLICHQDGISEKPPLLQEKSRAWQHPLFLHHTVWDTPAPRRPPTGPHAGQGTQKISHPPPPALSGVTGG